MRWSEAGYLSRIVLAHAPRQASVSLILGVRQKIMISQLTPFTCGLACWAQFMREQGIETSEEQILRNHRDICYWNPPHTHTYGSLDPNRLVALAGRYLWRARRLESLDLVDLTRYSLEEGSALFLFAASHREQEGLAHISRIKSISDEIVTLHDPAFPYGTVFKASFQDITTKWKPNIVYAFRG
jgi:hypothetical protein